MRRPIPPWAWLVGIVVASALVRYLLARRVPAPWIFVDELIYSELAKSLAESGELTVRDEPAGGAYGVVYPVLLAPAWALFDAVPDAYAAAKAINAVVMSLAAVPAYLLARRLLGVTWSLVAAALAVAVPSMAYTATLMTENAFYPLFLTAALALVTYLDRPTAVRAAVLLGVVALAVLTRVQALVLLPALVTAPLLLALLASRGLRPYRDLYWLVAGALAALLAVQVVRGRSPRGILGAYEPVSDRGYDVASTLRWLAYHTAELGLYVAVVPLVALVLLAVQARALEPPAQAFVATAVSLTAWMLVAVAAFASEVPVPPRVMERNVFHVVPLLVVALLVWLDAGAPRRRQTALAAGAGVTALALFLPFKDLFVSEATADTLALLPWWRLDDAGIDPSWVAPPAVAAAAALVFVPRRVLPWLVGVPVAAFAVTAVFAQFSGRGIEKAARDALAAGIGVPPDWIDRAAGGSARVAAVSTGHGDPHRVWENEFFNRSVGDVLRVATPLPGDLPEKPFTDAHAALAVSDGTLPLAGRVVAVDEGTGLVLYATGGALTPIGGVDGLYPNDTWSGASVRYRLHPCPPATLEVLVRSDAALAGPPQTVRAAGVRAVVPIGATRVLRVPLRPVEGICTIVFTISPTRIAPGDPRELGLRFERFLVRR